MEASGRFGKGGSGRSGPGLTRSGSVLIALVAALIAGGLIYLFVSHYHKSTPTVNTTPSTATVFAATKYIPAGTPETEVVSENLIKSEVVPATQVIAGAISDPSQIAGQVAAAAIATGQQITVSDFSHTNVTISAYLTGDYRAIALPIDVVHGLTAYLGVGSKIDVVVAETAGSYFLFENVTVIANPGGGYVVLKLTQKQILALVNVEHTPTAVIWLALRPLTGATDQVPPLQVAKVVS
jgi:Flp pilus assembly protein CpaB